MIQKGSNAHFVHFDHATPAEPKKVKTEKKQVTVVPAKLDNKKTPEIADVVSVAPVPAKKAEKK